ncbi:unnamed protein product [Medioppia subpectinata]|uniref:Uncharacterized protein n=1 Tax=Medioppia subpectinata TaxID=1979941 RepID=A0A7R9PT09_9ACAR|nr:unnamed protein product [Medioppia subpectinata]CAG2100184.1 unnamed protein product [Medioppia subpectinata]
MLGATSESMIGIIVFSSTLMVMALLVVVFLCKTDRKKREDMARRLSKACINSGRRLSTIFVADRRLPTISGPLIRFETNTQNSVYRSVPIIYESNAENKPEFRDQRNESKLKYSSSGNLNKSDDLSTNH